MLVRAKYVLLSSGELRQGCALRIQGDRITEIGSYAELARCYPLDPVIGNGKQLLLPGLIDAHTHGAGLSFIQRGKQYDILENALLDFESSVDISPEINSMLNAVRHIRNGCTTIHHNNWGMPLDPHALENSRKRIEGYRKVGIRLGFSCGIRNENILAYGEREFLDELPTDLRKEVAYLTDYDPARAAQEFFHEFHTLYREYNSDAVKVFLGPNWVQGSTDDFLREVKETADSLGKIPIHIHTLQTPIQRAYGLRTYQKSLVSHLDDLGLVDDNLVLGHAVYLSESDITLLGERKASITHHPSCNLAMRNGIAPILPMLKAGINVAMGIDEKGINDDEDVIMEMRMIFFLHRIGAFRLTDNPALSSKDVLAIATRNGSFVSGYGDELGKIEVGRLADLILVDLEQVLDEPWSAPDADILHMFLHRGMGHHVNTVIVGGEVVMRERKILSIDVETLYERAREEAQRRWSEVDARYGRTLERIRPYYQKRYDKWLLESQYNPYYIFNSRT